MLHVNSSLPIDELGTYHVSTLTIPEAREVLVTAESNGDVKCHIGFASTCDMIEAATGVYLVVPRKKANRLTILESGDRVLLVRPHRDVKIDANTLLQPEMFRWWLVEYE